jgi:hypothetical protein
MSYRRKEKPRLRGQSADGVSVSRRWYCGFQQQNIANKPGTISPRSFWCQVAWETYRTDRLPPDNPRRKPTLARVRFLDGGAS